MAFGTTTPMGAALVNCDWAILGAKQYGGSSVMLVASNQMHTMSVTVGYEDSECMSVFGAIREPIRDSRGDRIELTAILDNCVIIYAPDYQSALARLPDLFGAWERGERWGGQRADGHILDEAPPQAIAAGPKELPWGG